MDGIKAGASDKASSRYRKNAYEDDEEEEEEAIMLETALRESAKLSEAEAAMRGYAIEDEDEQDASVAMLEDMGFERSRIIKTLGLTGGNCEAAINMLLR